MEPLPSEHEPPSLGRQVLLVLLALQLLGVSGVVIGFAPKFAEFYSDFSGGEAQLPALTTGLLTLATYLRTNMILPILVLTLLIGWLISRFRGDGLELPLLIILNLFAFTSFMIVAIALYLPIFNLVNGIK